MEVKPLRHSSVPAGYKQTEVGIIPEEWDVESLERISDPKRTICYGIVQVGQFKNNGINVLAIKNLNGDYATKLHRCSPEIERPYVRSRVCPGDVLVSVKGTVGRVGLVPQHYVGNISRDLARISLTDSDIPAFWHQLLQSEPAQRRLEAATVGTTRLELSIAPLKKVKMPRPPKPEQRAIAEALSDVDGLLGGLDRLIAKKRDLKQAAMQQLLTGQTRLPGFRGEWEVKQLGEICELKMGRTPPRLNPAFWGEGYVWLSIADLQSKVVSSSKEQVTKAAAATMELIPKGTLLMSFKLSIGRLCFAGCDLFTNEAICSFNRLTANADYLYYALGRVDFSLYGKQAVKGYTLNKESLKTVKVTLPPSAEQTAIAEVLTEMDAELAALEERREKTRALKQAMMQELLTGRLRLV